ncbi:hypothetical protein AAC387_Pa12g1415 [Persea americana]
MANQRAHVVVVPYPSQGHINPLLQFAKRLSSKGLKATLATTHYTVDTIHAQGVTIEPISDGFDQGGFSHAPNADVYLEKFKTHGSKTLSDLIKKHKETSSPVTCVIYDSFLIWALDVAREHGLVGASFFTNSATVCSIFCRASHGHFEVPLDPKQRPFSFPGLPVLEYEDLPNFLTSAEVYPAYKKMVFNQFSNVREADWVFGNTFERLEGEALKAISSLWPAKLIGPMVPSFYLDGRIKCDKSYGAHLWRPIGSKCMDWLDQKPGGSVVYASFGSMAHVPPNQMEEVASALKECNKHFIWVVKESEQPKLPDKFLQSIDDDKGLVITWCSQLEVLAHQAVGCFVTHCGWNSTLEALSVGVPLVAVPQWTDQPTNAKQVRDIWGVGVRAKMDEEGIVWREDIKHCIREVMEGKKAEEIKKNTIKWKKLAKDAVDEGGSSDKNIEDFVRMLVKWKGQTTLCNGHGQT